jgi:hypothetical protein
MKMEQCVPKRRHTKFRRRGITQKKTYNNHKNIKYKLLKTNAAIWYNKMYRSSHLTPRYMNIQCNDSFGLTIKLSLTVAQ